MNNRINILLFSSLLIIFSCGNHKEKFVFFNYEKKFGIRKVEASKISKVNNFQDVDYFGSLRSGSEISFNQNLYKPVRCRQGTIVEFGSCYEFIGGKLKIVNFKLTNDEFEMIFKKNDTLILDSFSLKASNRKITIKKKEKLVFVEEFDTINGIVYNIYINDKNCFILEAKAGQTTKKSNGFHYKVSSDSLNLREFTKPIQFLYEQYSEPLHKHFEKSPYISSGRYFGF